MSVFTSPSYKDFIREFIRRQDKGGHGEVTRLAREMGVHPTLVSQVLRGDKDLSLEQAFKVCAYLGLSGQEKDFFLLLIQHERAGTPDLKAYYRKMIEDARKKSRDIGSRLQQHRRLTDIERSIFYSSWIYSAIRLFASVGEGQTATGIAEKFGLSRADVAKYLSFLKEAGLVAEQDGVYKIGSQQTHLEFGSPFLTRHHSNWRIKAIQRSETLTSEELMFTSPFSVSRKDFEIIRDQIADLIKKTSQTIKDSPAEEVACLNIDLFWIEKTIN